MSKKKKSKNKNKNKKTCFLSAIEAQKWFEMSKVLSKSLLSMDDAIHTYNKLSASERRQIRTSLLILDEQRKRVFQNINKEEVEQHYFDSIFVDSHIVATDYNTDPVVVLMCIKAPCSLLNKVMIK